SGHKTQLILYAYATGQHNTALAYWSFEECRIQWIYIPEHVQNRWMTQGNAQSQIKPLITSAEELSNLITRCLTQFADWRKFINTQKQFPATPSLSGCAYCEYDGVCRKDDPTATRKSNISN
ncbi:MAG: PD-(D/E)XK nuclease family protein, partial [Proteobacteria bacterium]|nr:PD-(D/E)XK nuclease family protein [Pseudomonadota bacterium]